MVWNRACARKYGISKEAALGHNLLELFPQIASDYRVTCFRKSAKEGQSFFFPNLPNLYSEGMYSQVILPLHNEQKRLMGTLSIVRNGEAERIRMEDLVKPLRAPEMAHHSH